MMTGSWRPVSTVTSLQRPEDGGQNVLIDYGHGDIVNRSVINYTLSIPCTDST